MLFAGSGLLMLLGMGWGIFFASIGAWIIVVMDVAMLLLGATIATLTRYKRTRIASFLMVGGMYLVIGSVCLLFDVPSAWVPRSTHHFLIVLAICSLLFLRNDHAVFRFAITALCLISFVVLASHPADFGSPYRLPDSVRLTGTWVNNFFAALGLYLLFHITVSELTEHSSLELDLRKAIGNNELFLLYQPQVTSQGHVLGAEALVRWFHPRRGLIGPTGLILPLGAWVLRTACAQLVAWSMQPKMAELTLSVNVSVHQFRQPDFVEHVQSALEHSGVRSQRLKLELTESTLVHDIEDIVAKMHAIRALGVGFSLDDFGTGYSSLNYLKRLPLDQLKIDQSFVRDVLTDASDASIARMVISLGKSLGFNVIAEGVETQGQREFLVNNDCHTFQGYLFSKPLPADQFREFCAGN